MKRHVARTVMGFAAALFLVGAPPPSARGTAGPAAQDPEPRTGEFTDTLKDPDTKVMVMRYKMRAPERLPEFRHLGLIVYFHGMNGNERSLYGFTTGALKRLGIADEYVVMGGKSRGAGWSTNDDKFVLKWIDWAKRTYRIDERRIHIVGGSNGGWMVKRFGWENQNLVATVAAYCGGGVNFTGTSGGGRTGPRTPPGAAAETKTEFYFVHGTDDTAVGVDASQRACRQLGGLGYRYIYRELAGHDHGSIFRVNEVADDAFAWMHALRHKEIPLNKADRLALSAMSRKVSSAKRDESARMLSEVARIGGGWGARAIARAFRAKDEEVRVRAAGTTTTTLYGRSIVIELVKLTRNKSEAVRTAALQGLAAASKWRYAEAQQALCQLARTRGKAVEQRVVAIEGLAKTAKLMLLGNFDDKDILITLVLLLEDGELRIRESAFAALKDGVKDTFEYAPDLEPPELKTSVGKWKSWLSRVIEAK